MTFSPSGYLMSLPGDDSVLVAPDLVSVEDPLSDAGADEGLSPFPLAVVADFFA